jgi:NTP pyrophosphatase (non-canonical NTP hydrolase)
MLTDPTLQAVIANQNRIFGQRNRMRFHSLDVRLHFLLVAAGDFKKLVRKNKSPEILGIALARVLSRIICVAEHFGDDLPIAQAFSEKWLATTCRYCHHLPCTCDPSQRPDPTYEVNAEGLTWDLARIANHLEQLYGAANRAMGPVDILYSRLIEEITEALVNVVEMPHSTQPSEFLLKELALELCDAIAWTITIANYVGVDIQQAYLARYGSGCRNCKEIPCTCGAFQWPEAKDWAKQFE